MPDGSLSSCTVQHRQLVKDVENALNGVGPEAAPTTSGSSPKQIHLPICADVTIDYLGMVEASWSDPSNPSRSYELSFDDIDGTYMALWVEPKNVDILDAGQLDPADVQKAKELIAQQTVTPGSQSVTKVYQDLSTLVTELSEMLSE